MASTERDSSGHGDAKLGLNFPQICGSHPPLPEDSVVLSLFEYILQHLKTSFTGSIINKDLSLNKNWDELLCHLLWCTFCTGDSGKTCPGGKELLLETYNQMMGATLGLHEWLGHCWPTSCSKQSQGNVLGGQKATVQKCNATARPSLCPGHSASIYSLMFCLAFGKSFNYFAATHALWCHFVWCSAVSE